MNEVNLDKIVSIVVQKVINELLKNGIKIVSTNHTIENVDSGQNNSAYLRTKIERIDMSMYKTPILTENHFKKLHELTGEIIIPNGTIITPKAREIIKSKRILVKYE